MAFPSPVTGDTIEASHITDIVQAFDGTSGQGVAIKIIQLNDASNYALQVKNLEATNCYVFNAVNSAGDNLLTLNVNGANFGKSVWIQDSFGSGTTKWPLEILPTFNDTGTTFTCFKINVTDTDSASGSKLVDWQIGGTSKFLVSSKTGKVAIAGGFSNSGIVYLDHAAYTATADTNIARLLVENTNQITTSGTTAIAATIYAAPVNASGGTITRTATLYIEGMDTTAGTEANDFAIYSAAGRVEFLTTMTLASATGAVCNAVNVPAATITVTGTTQVTTATGFNLVNIAAPTYTDGSAVTIDIGATVYIGGAPTAGGSVTLTSGYALWVDAGTSRFDAGVYLGTTATAAALVSQATSGSGTTTHYIGNQTITTSSDSRVKTDIQEWQGSALELLRHAEPLKEFRYNLPGGGAQDSGYGPNARGKYLGFMAQETLKWAPWVVNAGAGADCQRCLAGLPCDEHSPFAVEYQHLVPLAITGIKELDVRLKQVEQQLDIS